MLLVITALIFLSFCLYSVIILLKEKEYKAAGRAFLLSIFTPLPYIIVAYIEIPNKEIVEWILLGLTYSFILLILLPIRATSKIKLYTPNTKIDERDIMFARSNLKKGDGNYEKYYKRRPENLENDEKFRKNPGFIGFGATYYKPAMFASAHASLFSVGQFKKGVTAEVAPETIQLNKTKLTTYLKNWSKKIGVKDIGITELKDYHKYSHDGRGGGANYGKEVVLNHKYAITFTIEMDYNYTRMAPDAPMAMESTQQYLTVGAIAMQIAHFIRHLGYDARAHIDGNYQVICPLVARDAGLGEIGRMGILMTPKLGPRVRLAVVTTELAFDLDKTYVDPSAIDFCKICKKCADVCPANAISFDDRKDINGVERWQINSDKCFKYWSTAGTDCGRCMGVCPYSHPNNFLHNIIRRGIRNNFIFRRMALLLDDFFYGKKPLSRPVPDWMKVS